MDPASSAGPIVSAEAPESLPFNPDALIREMRVSFRADGEGGFVTTHDNHSVAAKSGVIRFTPTSWVGSKAVNGATVEIETVGITRDQGDLSLGVAEATPDVGSLRIDRGVAEEQIHNRADGIEQTWTFQHEPAGTGPLEVRVAISGQRYMGASARGHHFIDESNGVGLRYSHATWIDLTGARTEVPVVFDAEVGELVMAVTAETLANSRYPAVLDPVVAAEQNAANPGIAPSAPNEEAPAVAYDGTNFFVVWSDNRDVTTYDIWGTFVNSAGVVLNQTGLPISGPVAGDQRDPALAFNGTNYLVVWEDSRRGLGVIDIRGRIISPAGNTIGGEIELSTSGLTANPDVTNIGTTWMAVWEDLRSTENSNVVFTSISAGGVVQEPQNLNDEPDTQVEPAIACSPTLCTVVFAEGPTPQEDIHRQRVNVAGRIDADSATISGDRMGRSLLPDIAFDGTNFLAVWMDQRNVNYDIYGQRITPDGVPMVEGGFVVNQSANNQRAPSVAHDGTAAIAVWQDSRNDNPRFDIFGTRILNDNTVTSPGGFTVNQQLGTQQLAPQIAAGGGQFYTVWEDERQGPPRDIRGVRMTATGNPANTTGTVLSTTADRQTGPNIAWGGAASGNNYLLVYSSNRTNGANDYDVVGFRVTQTGTPVRTSHFVIGGLVTGPQIGPELSFNGTDFLVVWADGRNGTTNFDIRGTRVNMAGADIVRDPNGGIVISAAPANQITPTLAWNAGANQWLVAWSDQRNSPGGNNDIYFGRVNPDGTTADGNGTPFSIQPDFQTRPDVSSNGTNWFIAYTDRPVGQVDQENIRGGFVSAAGVAGNPFSISQAAFRQEAPRTTFQGGNYIVVWTDTRLGLTNADVRGARVRPDGVVLDATGRTIAVNPTLNEQRPRIVNLGANVLITWSQSEAQGSPWLDLVGREFTPALAAVAPLFFISAVPQSSEDMSTIGVDTALSTVVGYARFDNTAGLRSERVKYRRVTFP